jgi:adenosylhomocysteine nucleosidase
VRKSGTVYTFIRDNAPVLLAVAGVGEENAYREAHRLLERVAVGGIVTIGFAGGLADSLNLGDIVLADSVIDQQTGERYDCSAELWRVENAHRGGLLSAGEVIRSAAEKRKLAGQWGAVAVDMESAGVARAAAESGVEFAAIKAITDTAGTSISFDFASCRSDDNGLSLWKIIREGMRTSQTIRDMWTLAKGSRVAARALAAAFGSGEWEGTR